MVQQGAHFNLVEGNACKGSKDVDGAGKHLRHRNISANNLSNVCPIDPFNT